jgi:hypothetical protein
MIPERQNSGAREIVIAKEHLGKHIVSAIVVTPCNNRRDAESGYHAVHHQDSALQ